MADGDNTTEPTGRVQAARGVGQNARSVLVAVIVAAILLLIAIAALQTH